jgi:hypothetical protein
MELFRNIGAAGCSAVITVTGIHPIDLVKTRLQISDPTNTKATNYKALGIQGTIKTIFEKEGIPAFWKGIAAAWMREASYTSLRLGLYSPIKKVMNVKKDSHFIMKFVAGSLAGVIGSFVGNPFDVLKTQLMSVESKTTPSMIQSAITLYKNEHIIGFYRGLQANMMRACVLNGTKMGCYDQISEYIKRSQIISPGLPTQFVSAFGAGLFMAIAVAPFDMIRTQLMNQSTKLYSGFFDCGTKLIIQRGFNGLYAGFIPIWARFAPTTCLQLIIFERIKPIFGVEGNGE